MSDFAPGQLYLGQKVDPSTAKATADAFTYDARDLTTHAVIVGMTGSGKTGLGVVLLEEALLSGIPALIIDPKGDMGNLLLDFPDFLPADFAPWVNEGEARLAGLPVGDYASKVAADWQTGLASAGIDAGRMRKLRDGAHLTIYTPGSTAGVPLNILGSLARPALSWDEDEEALRDEIEGFVSSLLGLAGIEADPIASREHILLANIIETVWRSGDDLDLAGLIGMVQTPPLRKLGVFDIDTFFPEKDRLGLAMRLNNLVASPSFSAWLEGPPLDIAGLMKAADGRPRGSIIYLAHLSDEERQFVVTLLLAKLVTWMRGQSGTTDLRALLYMEEVFGFAPPTAEPPSKKPILTLVKQARAYGVGTVLTTQNPVDLDYKVLSNAGTWFVGRLQTEQDKARIMDGLRSLAGGIDASTLDRLISALGKRQFVVNNVNNRQGPQVMQTRWAMSYLCGSLTKYQVELLMANNPERLQSASLGRSRAAASAFGTAPHGTPSSTGSDGDRGATAAIGHIGDPSSNSSPVAPPVARSVPVFYLNPAARWAAEVGARPNGRQLAPALVARCHLRYDDAAADVDHLEEWEAVFYPLGRFFDAASGRHVDYDDRDLLSNAPAGASYLLVDAPLADDKFFSGAASDLRDYLAASRRLEVYQNRTLKLYSRPGEAEPDFVARCQNLAEDQADREAAGLKAKYAARASRLRDAVAAARERAAEKEAQAKARGQHELLAGAGALLSVFLGGRATAAGMVSRAGRAISSASSRRGMAARADAAADAALEKADAQAAELEQVEAELAEELAAIDAKWKAVAADTRALNVSLEKSDVDVAQIALVWVPVG